MTRSSACFRVSLALLFLLTAVSASQAGLFGRWRGGYDYQYYYYPACPQTTVAAPSASTTPASGQPAVATTGPTTYTAAKPVVAPAPAAVPATGYYAPAPSTYQGGGWSTLPRSSWDFGGGFPPYNR